MSTELAPARLKMFGMKALTDDFTCICECCGSENQRGKMLPRLNRFNFKVFSMEHDPVPDVASGYDNVMFTDKEIGVLIQWRKS